MDLSKRSCASLWPWWPWRQLPGGYVRRCQLQRDSVSVRCRRPTWRATPCLHAHRSSSRWIDPVPQGERWLRRDRPRVEAGGVEAHQREQAVRRDVATLWATSIRASRLASSHRSRRIGQIAMGDMAALTERDRRPRGPRPAGRPTWAAAGVSKSTSGRGSRSAPAPIRFLNVGSVVSNARADFGGAETAQRPATRWRRGIRPAPLRGSRRRAGAAVRRRSRRRNALRGAATSPLGVFGQGAAMPGYGFVPAAGRRSPGCGRCGRASSRVFRHAAPRPRFQGLRERG